MTPKTAANFAITSALWLTMLPASSFSQESSHAQTNSALPVAPMSEQAQIFLNAGNLTTIEPLYLSFHPQQITLEEENLKILKDWLIKIGRSDTPIHIYSYATPPGSRMDMTPNRAQHMAMRKAFNRAIEAKNAIQTAGVSEQRIALHAVGPTGDSPVDQLRITLRQN